MTSVSSLQAARKLLTKHVSQRSHRWVHSSAADSLYATLGVHPAASDADIKRAFRQVGLAKPCLALPECVLHMHSSTKRSQASAVQCSICVES